MELTFLNLKENLAKTFFPALCLFGTDRWLLRKSVDIVCDACHVTDKNYGVDRLEAPSYAQLERSCCTPSMFSPVKVVVCSEFVFPQGRQMQETVSSLSSLVKNCDGSFCLVFIAEKFSPYDKVEGIVGVDCKKLDTSMVAKWIAAFAKRQGVSVDNICARRLADYCLNDMTRVEEETQKLIDYGEITLNSIEAMVSKDTEYKVFQLSNAVSQSSADAALKMYDALIASGEEARGLFGLLYNFYRRAYYTKISSCSDEQLCNYFAVKPYALVKVREVAQKYKPMQLKKILDIFSEADVRLKSFADENEVMKTIIFKISALRG